MGIVSRIFGEESYSKRSQAADYIDLSQYVPPAHEGDGAASTYVRCAEIRRFEDLKEFSRHVYDGNILILDFKGVMGDEILLKRLTNELRKIAQDVGGDIAGLGDNTILITPTGVKVDRRKLRAES